MSINSIEYLLFLHQSGVSTFLQEKPNNFYSEESKKLVINRKNVSNKIDEVTSLEQLENYIKLSTNCSLKNNANKTVFADGNPASKIMFIGEAPGAEEDRAGKPFVGLAGQLLNKMIAAINLSRDDIYITNIVPWRPPNNRTPNTEEILQCLPFIQKHIDIIKPIIIILLGGTASKAILATTHGITKIRGKWHQYNSLQINRPIPTRAIYHPAYLLRSPENKRTAWEDLKEVKKMIQKIKNEKS